MHVRFRCLKACQECRVGIKSTKKVACWFKLSLCLALIKDSLSKIMIWLSSRHMSNWGEKRNE